MPLTAALQLTEWRGPRKPSLLVFMQAGRLRPSLGACESFGIEVAGVMRPFEELDRVGATRLAAGAENDQAISSFQGFTP